MNGRLRSARSRLLRAVLVGSVLLVGCGGQVASDLGASGSSAQPGTRVASAGQSTSTTTAKTAGTAATVSGFGLAPGAAVLQAAEQLRGGGVLLTVTIDSIRTGDESIEVHMVAGPVFRGSASVFETGDAIVYFDASASDEVAAIGGWPLDDVGAGLLVATSEGEVVTIAVEDPNDVGRYLDPGNNHSVFALGGALELLAAGGPPVNRTCTLAAGLPGWGATPLAALEAYLDSADQRAAREDREVLQARAEFLSDDAALGVDEATGADLQADRLHIYEQLLAGVAEADLELIPKVPLVITMAGLPDPTPPAGAYDIVVFTDSNADRYLGWVDAGLTGDVTVLLDTPIGSTIRVWAVDSTTTIGCTDLTDRGLAAAALGILVGEIDAALAVNDSRVHFDVATGTSKPVK